jgi:DNA-directed RNA polymerase alpha subunit
MSKQESIEKLELPVRIYNRLKQAKIQNLEELLAMKYPDLVVALGKEDADEVIKHLGKSDLLP